MGLTLGSDLARHRRPDIGLATADQGGEAVAALEGGPLAIPAERDGLLYRAIRHPRAIRVV
jgi:hypothetical protein